jgi:hypothetical protein
MAQPIIRALPLFLQGQKVAEVASSTENRDINAALQYGIDGVVAVSIGADEISGLDFDTVIPVLGMNISIDSLIGVPIQIGSFRDGRMMLSNGVIKSSSYTSDSKTGEAKGKFTFIGGAPEFVV